MGIRGLTLLQLATQPLNERGPSWYQLVRERSEQATRALLRDYVRRGFLTTMDYQTTQLTEAGKERMRLGEEHEAQRAEDSHA